MLKFITIFFVVLYVTWGEENKVLIKISQAQLLVIRKYAATCGKEYGVNPRDLRKVFDWSLPNDIRHKQLIYCVFFTLGYITEDGHYDTDKMLELVPINGTLGYARQVYEDCNKITKKDKLETVYEMGTCFHRKLKPSPEKDNIL